MMTSISSTVVPMNNQQKLDYIKQRIGTFDNFPKEGVLFHDIFTSLLDGDVCKYLKDVLTSIVRENYPDVELIVGLESRGFLFNLLIAAELGVGCAPVRKIGKLPGNCISIKYTLEYGFDVFEIQSSAIKPGQKVLIIDDLLATGGSLDAATRLIRKAGGEVVGCLVIIELGFLNGRNKIDCKFNSLIKYP